MMFGNILPELKAIFVDALLPVSGLGFIFGLGLAFFSKIFAVKKDELVENLERALPGLNCGACGFAGCASYAQAIATKPDTELTLCTPGGSTVARKVAQIMGKQIDFTVVKQVAQVLCRGGRKTSQYKFAYQGIKDCNALFSLYGGDKTCPYSCLGLGSCLKVCPVNAIYYDKEGLVVVDPDLCVTCGKCLEICPTKVIQYIAYDTDYYVACNSTDKGPVTKKYCSVGCIGCQICAKKSPEGGFIIENFLARIDYKQQGDRTEAAQKCPPQCIIMTRHLPVSSKD